MNRKIKAVIGLLGICLLTAITGCGKGEAKMAEGITPIIDQEGADPSILKKDGIYYYTKTTGNNVSLFRSDTFTDVAAGEAKIVYEPNGDLKDLWAPEIIYLDEAWYIYFAATPQGEDVHYMYVLMNSNEDPFEGTWECMPVKGMDDKFAIDGTVLDTESGRYFIWSGWEGYENVRQDLYLAEMISPAEVKEEKILLSKPEYDWEKVGNPLVNEGPEILIREDTINLVYSASGSWTDDYCLGLLTAKKGSNLKNPASWKKEEEPICSSANGVYGPGHNGFTVSEDDSQDILIYHAARWQGAGWSRSVRFGYLTFDDSGKIQKIEPSDSNELLAFPSGEMAREIYFSDSFEKEGAVELQMDEGSLSKNVVSGFLETKDGISIEVSREKEGPCTVYVYLKIADAYDDSMATGIQADINGDTYVKTAFPAEYYQPIAFPVTLKKGKNVIRIGSEAGAVLLYVDRIEITK